ATAVVRDSGRDEYTFTVEVQILPDGVLKPLMTMEYSSRSGPGSSRVSSKGQTRIRDKTVADLTKDDIARAFTTHYLNSLRGRARPS
ncbi:MAG: hypothetical protein ACLQUY_22955, partial [Ktedonobacterales bacterium]